MSQDRSQTPEWTGDFLDSTRIPLRLACNGASGYPLLASLWFVPIDGVLWCATQKGAAVVSVLRRDPRCAFEVSVEKPPYRGVRGRAQASLVEARGEEILRMLLDRFLGESSEKLRRQLLSRADQEVAIALETDEMLAWDYSDRMQTTR